MGTIYLIRHGQAGFAQADYDVLSPLGAVQARQLGAYLHSARHAIDLLYSAPRRRHRETAHELRSAAGEAGLTLPEAVAAPHFDEFPFGDILLAAVNGDLGDEYRALRAELGGRDPLHDARAFNRLFQQAMKRWVAGSLQATESFSDFTQRVRAGFSAVAADARGKRVAVVTSAGAIAALLMQFMELSPAQMLKLCLALRNTSFSELRFRDDEVSVISVNEVPHLPDPAHRTFR